MKERKRNGMVTVYVIDCHPEYPEFDEQVHYHLPWRGFAIPGGRALGEWVWVGRIA